MRKFVTFGLLATVLLCSADTTFAQDKATQAAILQKLSEIERRITDIENRATNIENRLTEMDKRLTVLETKMDERFNAVNLRIDAVNQRIEDKFNLIVALLGVIVAFLALSNLPKWLERFKLKNDTPKLQSEIDALKTQIAQLMQKPTL